MANGDDPRLKTLATLAGSRKGQDDQESPAPHDLWQRVQQLLAPGYLGAKAREAEQSALEKLGETRPGKWFTEGYDKATEGMYHMRYGMDPETKAGGFHDFVEGMTPAMMVAGAPFAATAAPIDLIAGTLIAGETGYATEKGLTAAGVDPRIAKATADLTSIGSGWAIPAFAGEESWNVMGPVKKLNSEAFEAMTRIRDRLGGANYYAPDMDSIHDLVKMGAANMVAGVANYKQWAEKMMRDAGTRLIATYLPMVYQQSAQHAQARVGARPGPGPGSNRRK